MTVAVSTTARRSWWKYLAIIAGAALLLVLLGLWYLTTASFQSLVRRRVVAEVEQITGGKAEIGSFHTVPLHMQVDIRNITVHGLEGPKDVPLAHADRLVAELKVISFLRTELGFHELTLDHPVVHVAFDSNGNGNIPGLTIDRAEKIDFRRLFALSIDRLNVLQGELLWGDQKIPLDFSVRDTGLEMNYSYLHSRYEGRLQVGKVDTALDHFRPFSWMTDVEFSLAAESAEIKSLNVTSGKSRLQASGTIIDFWDPKIQGSYHALLDLSEAASIARRGDLHQGSLELKGSGSWSLANFGARGFASLQDFGGENKKLLIRNASATADYSITPQELSLSNLQGRLFSGSFAGDMQVENWTNFTRAPKNTPIEERAIISAVRPQSPILSKNPPLQSGALHLRLRELSVSDLTSTVNAGTHRLGRFHPAGFATGSLDARWRGIPIDAEIAFSLDVSPPSRSQDGELPVLARAQGTYRGAGDELELNKMNVTTPGSRIEASGILSASSALRLSVVTSDLDELRPIIALLHGPADVPLTIDGTATFTGVATGSPFAPGFSGNFMAQNFDFTLPATSHSPEQPVHWDSLSANLQYSPQNLTLRRGSLRRANTSAEFEVTSQLDNGEFTPASSFSAEFNLQNVDVGSTAALVGYDYPLTGSANVVLQMSGTRGSPRVHGAIHATGASAYGESISQFDGDLNIANGFTALNHVRLLHDSGVITGDASLNPTTHAFSLDLVGKGFDLTHIHEIPQGRVPVEGTADFVLQASGTPTNPRVNAKIQAIGLKLNHDSVGGFELSGVSHGHDLQLSGHSKFTRGQITLDGSVRMGSGYPFSVALHLDQLELGPFWRAYMRGDLTGPTTAGGTLTLDGPLGSPRLWTIHGDLSELSVNVEHVKLQNQDPVQFSYANQILQLRQLHLTGVNSDLRTNGSIDFGGSRKVEITAHGTTSLALLNTIDPDITAAGNLTMDMNLGGTTAEPLPQGRLEISNGSVAYAGVPSGLSEMNGALTFNRERVHIEQLVAHTGGGTLTFRGDATTNARQFNFNLTVSANDVRLRYPPGVSSTANAEMHWVGTRSGSTVSGDILVNKLAVTPNFDFGAYLEQSRGVGTITPANSPLNNVKLDIHVQTAPELQMRTASARLSGDADLRLRGSVAHPAVLGRADILEGEATFNGTRFRLERGDITFTNPAAIEPQVNLQASTHVRSYDLNVTVTGTPERLNVNYRSEPPLPKSDIIAMLALGRSEDAARLQEQQAYSQTTFTDEATTAAILNQALNSSETSRMQKLFGVSRIRIDPQGLTTETSPTARGPQVTIEQQFSNNVSLSYSTNVSQTGDQIIQGEYFLTPNTSVVGTRDWNGVVSFDVRLRRHKK